MADCSENVWRDRQGHTCLKVAKVVRDGKPYCAIHDPERVAAKRAERNAQWDAKRKADEARQAESRIRIHRLGFGSPAYRAYAAIYEGSTGGVTLTGDEADRLIARVESAEKDAFDAITFGDVMRCRACGRYAVKSGLKCQACGAS